MSIRLTKRAGQVLDKDHAAEYALRDEAKALSLLRTGDLETSIIKAIEKIYSTDEEMEAEQDNIIGALQRVLDKAHGLWKTKARHR